MLDKIVIKTTITAKQAYTKRQNQTSKQTCRQEKMAKEPKHKQANKLGKSFYMYMCTISNDTAHQNISILC